MRLEGNTAAGFKLLPEVGRSVPEWRSAGAAFLDVALGLGKLVRTVRTEMAKDGAHPKKPAAVAPKMKLPSKPNAPKAKAPAKVSGPKPKPDRAKVASSGRVTSLSKARGTADGGKRPSPKVR